MKTQNKWVFIAFSKDNCELCQKNMAVYIETLKDKKDFSIEKIDTPMNQSLAEKYEITTVPTLIIFKYGRQVWKQVDKVEATEILELIN